jgi:hypothetical protein
MSILSHMILFYNVFMFIMLFTSILHFFYFFNFLICAYFDTNVMTKKLKMQRVLCSLLSLLLWNNVFAHKAINSIASSTSSSSTGGGGGAGTTNMCTGLYSTFDLISLDSPIIISSLVASTVIYADGGASNININCPTICNMTLNTPSSCESTNINCGVSSCNGYWMNLYLPGYKMPTCPHGMNNLNCAYYGTSTFDTTTVTTFYTNFINYYRNLYSSQTGNVIMNSDQTISITINTALAVNYINFINIDYVNNNINLLCPSGTCAGYTGMVIIDNLSVNVNDEIILNNLNPTQFFIFVTGSINFNSGPLYTGTIIAPGCDVTVNVDFIGFIIANSITLNQQFSPFSNCIKTLGCSYCTGITASLAISSSAMSSSTPISSSAISSSVLKSSSTFSSSAISSSNIKSSSLQISSSVFSSSSVPSSSVFSSSTVRSSSAFSSSPTPSSSAFSSSMFSSSTAVHSSSVFSSSMTPSSSAFSSSMTPSSSAFSSSMTPSSSAFSSSTAVHSSSAFSSSMTPSSSSSSISSSSSAVFSCSNFDSYNTCMGTNICVWTGQITFGTCTNGPVACGNLLDTPTCQLAASSSISQNPYLLLGYLTSPCTWSTVSQTCIPVYGNPCNDYSGLSSLYCATENSDRCYYDPITGSCNGIDIGVYFQIQINDIEVFVENGRMMMTYNVYIPLILSALPTVVNSEHNIIWLGDVSLIQNAWPTGFLTYNPLCSTMAATELNWDGSSGVIFDSFIERSLYLQSLNNSLVDQMDTDTIVTELLGDMLGYWPASMLTSTSIIGDYTSITTTGVIGTFGNIQLVNGIKVDLDAASSPSNCNYLGVTKIVIENNDMDQIIYTVPTTAFRRTSLETALSETRLITVTILNGANIIIDTTTNQLYSKLITIQTLGAQNCDTSSTIATVNYEQMTMSFLITYTGIPPNTYVGPYSYPITTTSTNCYGDQITFTVNPCTTNSLGVHSCSSIVTITSGCRYIQDNTGIEFDTCSGNSYTLSPYDRRHDFNIPVQICHINNNNVINCTNIIATNEISNVSISYGVYQSVEIEPDVIIENTDVIGFVTTNFSQLTAASLASISSISSIVSTTSQTSDTYGTQICILAFSNSSIWYPWTMYMNTSSITVIQIPSDPTQPTTTHTFAQLLSYPGVVTYTPRSIGLDNSISLLQTVSYADAFVINLNKLIFVPWFSPGTLQFYIHITMEFIDGPQRRLLSTTTTSTQTTNSHLMLSIDTRDFYFQIYKSDGPIVPYNETTISYLYQNADQTLDGCIEQNDLYERILYYNDTSPYTSIHDFHIFILVQRACTFPILFVIQLLTFIFKLISCYRDNSHDNDKKFSRTVVIILTCGYILVMLGCTASIISMNLWPSNTSYTVREFIYRFLNVALAFELTISVMIIIECFNSILTLWNPVFDNTSKSFTTTHYKTICILVSINASDWPNGSIYWTQILGGLIPLFIPPDFFLIIISFSYLFKKPTREQAIDMLQNLVYFIAFLIISIVICLIDSTGDTFISPKYFYVTQGSTTEVIGFQILTIVLLSFDFILILTLLILSNTHTQCCNRFRNCLHVQKTYEKALRRFEQKIGPVTSTTNDNDDKLNLITRQTLKERSQSKMKARSQSLKPIKSTKYTRTANTTNTTNLRNIVTI